MDKPTDQQSKECTDCHKVKPLTEFYLQKRRHCIVPKSQCKECSRVRGKAYRQNNAEKLSDYQKKYLSDPERAERANKRHLRDHKRRHASTIVTATHHNQPWTGPQLEIAARDDLSIVEIARMTGRSSNAVANMRLRIKVEDPKTMSLLGWNVYGSPVESRKLGD